MTADRPTLDPISGEVLPRPLSRGVHTPHEAHVAHIYDTDEELVSLVTSYAEAAIRGGEAVVLIATTAHLAAVEERLLGAGFDLVTALERGAYIQVSAREVLAEVVGPDGPTALRFLDFVAPLVARAAGSGRRFRFYGEAVSLLAEDGREEATLEMEGLWNGFLARRPFPLLCGYASAALRGPSFEHMRSSIRACHAATPAGAVARSPKLRTLLPPLIQPRP